MQWPDTYRGNHDARNILGNRVTRFAKEGRILKILLSGPSGVGKNYTIEVVAKFLNLRMIEVSGRDLATVAGLRTLIYRAYTETITKGGAIIFIDEGQSMTDVAQNLILKPMEQGEFQWEVGSPIPLPNVHWVIATTKPEKLIDDIHTRCKQIILEKLTDDEMYNLVTEMLGSLAKPSIVEAIVDQAQGIPRNAKNLVDDAFDVGVSSRNSVLAQAGLSPDGLNSRQESILRALMTFDAQASLDDISSATGMTTGLVKLEEIGLRNMEYIGKSNRGRILRAKGLRYMKTLIEAKN